MEERSINHPAVFVKSGGETKTLCSNKVSVTRRLHVCGIHHPPDEQHEPRDVVVDYEHERSVEGNSRGDGEVQHDVGSLPVLRLGLLHLQLDFMKGLTSETTEKHRSGERTEPGWIKE